MVADPDNDAEFFFLRPRDVATYVGAGTLDAGITGRDLLLDSAARADEVLALDFGASTLRFAARPGEVRSVADLSGLRVATSYSHVVGKYLAGHGVEVDLVPLDGAVETAVRLGVADVIADVVDTGLTIRQAGLELVGDPVLESEAVLVRRAGAEPDPAVDQLVRRLQGVLVARRYVLMDYDVRVEHLEQASALTPGFESPTVSPLADSGLGRGAGDGRAGRAQKTMDELWDVGARAILVTDIHACRL